MSEAPPSSPEQPTQPFSLTIEQVRLLDVYRRLDRHGQIALLSLGTQLAEGVLPERHLPLLQLRLLQALRTRIEGDRPDPV